MADERLAREVGRLKGVSSASKSSCSAVKGSWSSPSTVSGSQEGSKWLEKLKAGDLSGLEVHPEQYLRLRDEPLQGNPRSEPEYKERCVEAVGLGKVPDERYTHITAKDDFELL